MPGQQHNCLNPQSETYSGGALEQRRPYLDVDAITRASYLPLWRPDLIRFARSQPGRRCITELSPSRSNNAGLTSVCGQFWRPLRNVGEPMTLQPIALRFWRDMHTVRHRRVGKGSVFACGFARATGDSTVMHAGGSNGADGILKLVTASLEGMDCFMGTPFAKGWCA
jgi:hypothetical protein